MSGCLVVLLAGLLDSWLGGWLLALDHLQRPGKNVKSPKEARGQISKMSGCIVAWLGGWLDGCLAGWLVGCLSVWLVG